MNPKGLPTMNDIPFASRNLTEHLLRGAIGFAAIFFAIYLGSAHPFVAIGLGVLALFAFRGCPTCWLAGFFGTKCRIRQGPPTP